MSERQPETESIATYQTTLVENVIPNMSFKFNNRPVANIKNGNMYNLQKFNSHIINGLYVTNFTFFERAYGSNPSDKNVKCYLKGYADIVNENVKKILISKQSNFFLPISKFRIQKRSLKFYPFDVTSVAMSEKYCHKKVLKRNIFQTKFSIYNKNPRKIVTTIL